VITREDAGCEVHHAVPRCLLRLHDVVMDRDLADEERAEVLLEFERWRIPVEISREDLERLVEASVELLETQKHRLLHESDFVRWGRRGGLATLRRYGTDWYALLALRRWGRISPTDLEAARPLA
jgi:hypothetical protein